jgi:hypothetical protein
MRRNMRGMNRTGFVKAVGAGAAAMAGAAMLGSGLTHAQTPPSPPITPVEALSAEVAFDMKAVDARVVFIDVRAPDEIKWNGAFGQVESILATDGKTYAPYDKKAKFVGNEQVLKFDDQNMGPMALPIKKITKCNMSSWADANIPFILWKYLFEGSTYPSCVGVMPKEFGLPPQAYHRALAPGGRLDNTSRPFHMDVKDFIGSDVYGQDIIIILGCRSGTRAPDAAKAVAYVIDELGNSNNTPVYYLGRGLNGTNYNYAFNGYSGFPGRKVSIKENSILSWMDVGLPVIDMPIWEKPPTYPSGIPAKCSPNPYPPYYWTLRTGETLPW